MKKILCIIIVCLLFSVSVVAGVTAQSDTPVRTGAGGLPWWNDRVFYEIFVRSFYDSDGDGIGDFRGIIEKLDYLNDGDPATTDDLGVTGLWLMPIYPSPSYHGYDVTDYYDVNSDYGTLDDFKALVQAAHERGIAVIIDMEINHTSSQHPWFQASRDQDSEFARWYIWQDENPGYFGPTGQTVWHPLDGRYYYGIFWSEMPDLNYENPLVTDEMNSIAQFWLEETGIDGFRLDGARFVVEEGRLQEDTNSTLTWLANYRNFVHSINPDALVVGEIWTSTTTIARYMDAGSVDIAFEFDLASDLISAARFGAASLATDQIELVQQTYPFAQVAPFLSNHDQTRAMDAFLGNVDNAKTAASLLLTLPGVPFLYYGEEIGMMGKKPDELIRAPMQWDSTENTGGFTTGTAWEPLQANYPEVNVAAETGDPDSLLNHYRTLIQARNNSPALRAGSFTFVESTERRVYSILRHLDNESVLVILNPTNSSLEDYQLSLAQGPLMTISSAEWLIGEGDIPLPAINTAGGFDAYTPLPVIPPFSLYILRLSS